MFWSFQILFLKLIFTWHIIFHPIFFHFPPFWLFKFSVLSLLICVFIFQAFLLWTTYGWVYPILQSLLLLWVFGTFMLTELNGWIYDYHISICFLFILCIIVSLCSLSPESICYKRYSYTGCEEVRCYNVRKPYD